MTDSNQIPKNEQNVVHDDRHDLTRSPEVILWLATARAFFVQFIQFFLKKTVKSYQYLDDQPPVLDPFDTRLNMRADQCVAATILDKNSEEQKEIYFFEFQDGFNPKFAEHVFIVWKTATIRYDSDDGAPFGISINPMADPNPVEIKIDDSNFNLHFKFRCHNLSEMTEIELWDHENPFSLIVLASQHRLADQDDNSCQDYFKKLIRLAVDKLGPYTLDVLPYCFFCGCHLGIGTGDQYAIITKILSELDMANVPERVFLLLEAWLDAKSPGTVEAKTKARVAKNCLSRGLSVEETALLTELSEDEVRIMKK